MLAYVFWHWPSRESGYEAALLAFHRALAGAPPPGFRGSRTARIGERPWLPPRRPGTCAYEDWYFVDDFAALGVLDAAAVSGPRRAPHDVVAALPAGGTAALYGSVRGTLRRPRHAAFRSKPGGVAYASYLAALPATAEVWQRKMVLGPAPEFCLFTQEALEDSMGIDVLYPDA